MASNAEIELEAFGTYRADDSDKGLGQLDLTSRITRLHASLSTASTAGCRPRTLEWLQYALVSGRVSDGTVRNQGCPCSCFHSKANASEFRIAARVTDASLDVHPVAIQGERSPEATRTCAAAETIDGRFVLDGGSMTVTAQRGTAYRAKLSKLSRAFRTSGAMQC